MEKPQYHVIKSSRKYLGYAYSGPALAKTEFADRESATFDTLPAAVRCANQLNSNNPVGFHIYYDGKLVWPEGAEPQQSVTDVAAPDEYALRLAGYVQASAKCHEDNYDREAADKAEQKAEADYENAKASGDPYYYLNVVDFSQFYKLSLRQAVELTVPAALVEPVYLLLQLGWNDALDWAKRITEGKPS